MVRHFGLCALALWMLVFASPAAAQHEPIPAESGVVSVGLFKNGLAVIRRQVAVERSGLYRLDDLPMPVHGTFWIESDAKVITRAITQQVERPATSGDGLDMQSDLAGLEVRLTLRDRDEPIVGQVVAQPPGERSHQRQSNGRIWPSNASAAQAAASPQRFLVLQTGDGRTYVDTSQIVSIHAADGRGIVRREQPVLLLHVESDGPAVVQISYLSHGMTWAPSYRVDISDPDRLRVEQSAVVRNELLDIAGAEVFLISGFPSVQFGHVTSLLTAQGDLSSFFAQLSQSQRRNHDVMSNGFVTQQVAVVRSNEPGFDPSAVPSGDGVDLHYQPIGPQTLAEGDALSLSIAAADAAYDRIVEWTVPDTRDARGRQVRSSQDGDADVPWDALRFRNPFDFPMTTAPAMVVANGQFNGQRTSYWVSPGEQTTLQVTQALSVRALHSEHEEPDEREFIHVGGQRYRRVTVNGQLQISNHRAEDIEMVIRREFSGDLVEASGEPTVTLAESGVYSVNRRNVMRWTLSIGSGDQQRLTYQYTVLVAY